MGYFVDRPWRGDDRGLGSKTNHKRYIELGDNALHSINEVYKDLMLTVFIELQNSASYLSLHRQSFFRLLQWAINLQDTMK